MAEKRKKREKAVMRNEMKRASKKKPDMRSKSNVKVRKRANIASF